MVVGGREAGKLLLGSFSAFDASTVPFELILSLSSQRSAPNLSPLSLPSPLSLLSPPSTLELLAPFTCEMSAKAASVEVLEVVRKKAVVYGPSYYASKLGDPYEPNKAVMRMVSLRASFLYWESRRGGQRENWEKEEIGRGRRRPPSFFPPMSLSLALTPSASNLKLVLVCISYLILLLSHRCRPGILLICSTCGNETSVLSRASTRSLEQRTPSIRTSSSPGNNSEDTGVRD